MRDEWKRFVERTPLAPMARSLKRLLSADRELSLRERAALYDVQTVEVMKRVLAPDSTAVDVGAHQGAILAEIVKLAPRGRHYAFEPLPALAPALRQRFPSVEVFECALSDTAGSASFEFVKSSPGYSGLRPRHYGFRNPEIERITVRTDTLDNVIPPHVEVAFVKIDVEGGEHHAMLGGLATLRRCRPVIVFEAAAQSTGMYGVSPADLYELVTRRICLRLSTMDRWLRGRAAYRLEDFVANWENGPEFYFIAYA